MVHEIIFGQTSDKKWTEKMVFKINILDFSINILKIAKIIQGNKLTCYLYESDD